MAKATAAAVPQRQRVSLLKDNFVKGGILPEGPYLIKESSFVIFAYADKDGRPTGATTTAKRLLLQAVTKDGAGKFHEDTGAQASDQHWSIGDTKNFVPSEDGNYLEAVGRTTLSQQSKYFKLYESMVEAGVPEQLYDQEGAKLLVGAIVQIAHKEVDYSELRKRNQTAGVGSVNPQANAGTEKKRDFPETVPVIKAVYFAPWDSKGGAKKAAPAAKPAPAAAEETETGADESGDEGNQRVAEFIKKAAINAGGKITKTKARLEVHKQYNAAKIDAATRDAELKVFDDTDALGNLLAEVSCSLENGTIEYVE